MRIIVGELQHEGNNFANMRIDYEQFDPLLRDQALQTPNRLSGSAAEGIIHTLTAANVDLVPTVFANARAAPVAKASAYDRIKTEFLQNIRRAGTVDGICLALHGSMFVENEPDPEGDLLQAIREAVGPEVPIAASLDMHASMTQRMVDAVQGLAGYHTAPHVDMYETGCRAANLLLRTLRTGTKLAVEWMPIPMLLSGEQSETRAWPMSERIAHLQSVMSHEAILDASYLLGFPWADSPVNHCSALVVGSENDRLFLKECVTELAESLWAQRHAFDFTTEAHPLAEALAVAQASDLRPVVIADAGDNPTAGAVQDSAYPIKVLLEETIRGALFVYLFDAKAVQMCEQAGVGATVSLELGRSHPGVDDTALSVTATVKHLDHVFRTNCAVIDVKGNTVILGDRRTAAIAAYSHAVYEPRFVTELGLDFADYPMVIVKSGYLSPKYQALAAKAMLAMTPGDTNIVLTDIAYKAVCRPVFPLDPNMTWEAGQKDG